jgi:hypothetical protein
MPAAGAAASALNAVPPVPTADVREKVEPPRRRERRRRRVHNDAPQAHQPNRMRGRRADVEIPEIGRRSRRDARLLVEQIRRDRPEDVALGVGVNADLIFLRGT